VNCTEMAKNQVRRKWRCKASRLYYYSLKNRGITVCPVAAEVTEYENFIWRL
jgi:hypothetical protein